MHPDVTLKVPPAFLLLPRFGLGLAQSDLHVLAAYMQRNARGA